MRKLQTMIKVAAFCAATLPLHGQDGGSTNPPANSAPEVPNLDEFDPGEASYVIGLSIGKNLKQQFEGIAGSYEKFDSSRAQEGILEALGDKQKMSDEELQDYVQRLSSAMQMAQQKKAEELAAKNLVKSQEFLENNKKREGVMVTESGLQYEVIKMGDGEKPRASDQVNAIYKGMLIDGSVFDDSQGNPRQFGVTQVIKGWIEALQLMPVGSKWKLYVPPSLAYGGQQRGPLIEPNSTLVFEIELVEIVKPVSAVTSPVGIDLNTGEEIAPPAVRAVSEPVQVPPAKAKPVTEEDLKKAEQQ